MEAAPVAGALRFEFCLKAPRPKSRAAAAGATAVSGAGNMPRLRFPESAISLRTVRRRHRMGRAAKRAATRLTRAEKSKGKNANDAGKLDEQGRNPAGT